MRDASCSTAATARGEGPRGFSLADSRTTPSRPSSAARLSSVGPGSYRGRTSRTGRQRRRIPPRSEEHTSELQSRPQLVCRLLLEKKKKNEKNHIDKKNKKKKTN